MCAVVYRGIKETVQQYGAANLAALIQNTTLNNPEKLFFMEEGDELFERVCCTALPSAYYMSNALMKLLHRSPIS